MDFIKLILSLYLITIYNTIHLEAACAKKTCFIYNNYTPQWNIGNTGYSNIMNGNAYHYSTSREDCCQICLNTPSCDGFLFFARQTECLLLSFQPGTSLSNGFIFPTPGWDSGFLGPWKGIVY